MMNKGDNKRIGAAENQGSKEFYNYYNKVIEILKDKTIKDNYKIDVVDKFCMAYINFDSSKFNKYF